VSSGGSDVQGVECSTRNCWHESSLCNFVKQSVGHRFLLSRLERAKAEEVGGRLQK
jgi:hypothetical protein